MAKTLKLGIRKSNVEQHLARYLETKSLQDQAAQRVKTQRDAIIAFVEAEGIEDDSGNRWFETDAFRAKRERRVSQQFDSETAMAWLVEQGGDIHERCVEMVPMIDEDSLLAAIFDESIPEDVAESWYTEKESFALKVDALS